MSAVEINCRNCKKESFLRREAIYEGFSKVGERLFCASCGFEFSCESEVPFLKRAVKPVLFDESDRSEKLDLFEEEEGRRICRHCAQYVVNPFTQFCAYYKREVEATDSCENFLLRQEEPDENSPI
jgi:hypothetical protein